MEDEQHMKNTRDASVPLWRWVFVFLLVLLVGTTAFEEDAGVLLSFKSSVTRDPNGSLGNWDATTPGAPCDWNGITCDHERRVVVLSLPESGITGTLVASLGAMVSLQRLNLRSNEFSGVIPPEIGSASALHKIILSGNHLSGGIPSEITALRSLETLDLAGNALVGSIPAGLGTLRLERLDLSENRLSGPIPPDLGSLSALLNLSGNVLTGSVPEELAALPRNASLDLSRNRLSGRIPAALAEKQPASSFEGNPALCGAPLRAPCSSAASAASPRMSPSPRNATSGTRNPSPLANRSSGLSVKQILAIAVGDAVGIALLGLVFIYCCRRRKPCDFVARRRIRRRRSKSTSIVAATIGRGSSSYSFSQLHQQPDHQPQLQRYENHHPDDEEHEDEDPDCLLNLCCICCCCCCSGDAPEWLEDANSGELVVFEDGPAGGVRDRDESGSKSGFTLEDLLRASAYVISKSGSSIVYKTVLENGLTLAVRRLATNEPSSKQRQKEFDSEVQLLGRIRHPCIVRLRAYYSGPDEKLLVYDYVNNGSLATALHGQAAPYSLTSLTWTERLRIARRVAQGLAHIHEVGPRKYIHGDVRPSNILLSSNMEAFVSDFGLTRLITITGSAVNSRSGSRNGTSSASIGLAAASTTSTAPTPTPTVLPTATVPTGGTSGSGGVPSLSINSGTPVDVEDHFKSAEESAAYRPPESLTTMGRRPTQKWDVYAFGVVMLELISGKKAVTLYRDRQRLAAGASSTTTTTTTVTPATTSGVAGPTTTVAGSTTTTTTTAEALSLVEWAEKLWECKRPVYEVLDPTLMHGITPPQKDVGDFFRVAVACVSSSPEQRPKMKQVVDLLKKVGGSAP